jgi:hypothetical protein
MIARTPGIAGGRMHNEVLSYAEACGFDVLDQRYYIWACDRQLATAGMTLLEAYRFATTTGVMLYVAARGEPAGLPLFPPITRFHGRGPPERIQCLRLAGPPVGLVRPL